MNKKHLKIVLSCVLALGMAIGTCGCSKGGSAAASGSSAATSQSGSQGGAESSSQAAASSAAAQSGKKLTFASVIPNIHPFFDPITVGAKDQLKKMGVDADVVCEGAMNGNVSQQIQIMEDLITKKVSGIAIGACDSDALTPYINKAVDAGIPVVSFDTDAPKSKRIAYIGTNNYQAGVAMGKELGKALNGKGTVICETGVVSQAGLIQRTKGVQSVLNSQYPNIKIVQTQASGGDVSKGLSDIENMITSFPKFDALIVIDAAGENGVSAFKSHGWTTKDKVLITFDDLDPVIAGVKNGQVYATITQGQYNWGVNIAEKLYDLTQGKTIPKNTDTGYIVINKSNVNTKYPNVK